MLFLLTNDDGVDSPGIERLAFRLSQHGEVYVVAPERERSAAGHSITMHKPIRARYKGEPVNRVKVWETSGSPADCVVVGIFDLLPRKPDLVVSGINLGPNLGEDLTYSGTVSGAMEGYLCDISSLAISLNTFVDPDWETASIVAEEVVKSAVELDFLVLLNVNVPNCPLFRIKGFSLTSLGKRRYISRLSKRTDPFGRPYYWIGGVLEEIPPQEGTDVWAVENQMVSISPLTLDLTDYRMLESLKPLVNKLEANFLPR
ncbi:MAG: 5'/3'-nucleotidase SurE [Caldiserica bacterium]|jgi:5'-nucleotidase|nr:5'/3'-nucleotidase SurE [Caldisericota bacterium]MDH7562971.1 5'/3'-nucleotidase SurE [Caldisericota bacterium]